MRVPRGPGPKSGRKPGGKAGPLKSGPKAPARARSAPKAAAARKATPKPPAKKPEKARATGKGGVVQDVRQFRVQSDDDGIRLDRWFKRHLPDVGFNIVSRWARPGQLRVAGARATPGARVAEGQVILGPTQGKPAQPWTQVPTLDISNNKTD